MLAIIIPTIGRQTLARAVSSVRHQTLYTECIVVKDTYRTGANPTRRRGVDKSTADWVGFCDDDDELDERYHEWLNPYMEDWDMVIFKMKNQPNGAIPYTDNVEELVYNEVGISFAARRSVIKTFRFHNRIGEDYDMIMQFKSHGYRIKIVDKIAYYLHGKDGTN